MADCIKVALRIRPLSDVEKGHGSKICVEAAKTEPQVSVKDGHNSSFTYNYVFDTDSQQEDIYEAAIHPLVKKLFDGFNVTILAYGQTGSGKTHTMGSNCIGNVADEDQGIIIRAVKEIFEHVNSSPEWSFKITASFMELYMENLYDLLAPLRNTVDIREESKRICIPGLTELVVQSTESTIQCLKNGSIGRVTGATAMNQQSSRSHAIFTLTIQQQRIDSPSTATTAKFHLVDLAGSERCKKTQAEGDRFKEGVTINAGLLALGNVISILGEGNKSVPSYRSSKLTRLLQDSLGGNSHTLMIACISPADYNLSETLSTLRYADRARRIKNRPIVNQDPKCAEIAFLKGKVEELQLQLLEKGGAGPSVDPEALRRLDQELKAMEIKLRTITNSYNNALLEIAVMQEKLMCLEAAQDRQKEIVAELDETVVETLKSFHAAKSIEDTLQCVNVLKKSFSERIAALHEDHAKTDLEQRKFKPDNKVSYVEDNMDEDFTEDLRMIDVRQEEHVNKQCMLKREMDELEQRLYATSEMCDQLTQRKHTVDDLEKQSLLHKEKYEKQIAALEKEKSELMASIKALQAANREVEVKAKQSELARKNTQIEELQKKLADHARIVRQKEAAEKKVESLQADIRQMKQAKVKIIKQMSQESAQWKAWRIEREREATRLREQDKKRQNEMVRKETLHMKQMNVTKRKLEEVAATNKRLKEALMKQKAVRVQREMKGNKEQIQEFVSREVEVLASTVEAERSLPTLLDYRAALNQEIAALRRRTIDSKSNKEIEILEEELELRSTQIADLQQKILDAEQESKSKRHWDMIGTMSDAKAALAHTMRLAADIKKEALDKEAQVQEVLAAQESLEREKSSAIRELQAKLDEMTRERAREREAHQQELLRLARENQEALDDLLPVAEREREQMEENEDLRSRLDTILSVTLKTDIEQCIKETPVLNGLDLNVSDVLDDKDKDPNWYPHWQKTPLYRRIQTARNSALGTKRALELVRCGCRSQCDTKRCICKKNNSGCGENCSCDPIKCAYKLSQSQEGSTLNETFTKESFNEPKRRRTIFNLTDD